MARNPLDDPAFVAGLRPVGSGSGDAPPSWPAVDVAGVAPDGSPVEVGLDGRTRPVLLVFLTTDCDGCDLFWRGVRDDAPVGVDTVVVTKGPESVSRQDVAGLAAGIAGPVVMSDRSWSDYRVTGYPFLVLVEPGARRILRETVGFGWSDAADLVAGSGRS